MGIRPVTHSSSRSEILGIYFIESKRSFGFQRRQALNISQPRSEPPITSLSNNSSRKKKKKKSGMLEKETEMLKRVLICYSIFQGRMYFSQKPAEIKGSQTDGGNACCLATQFRKYWINRHLETSLHSQIGITRSLMSCWYYIASWCSLGKFKCLYPRLKWYLIIFSINNP